MLKEGGLTTLCVALVCPLQDTNQYTICVVNVGDSFAFIMSKRWGLREITVGSHDIQSERDLRDAGGALGPVDGKNPELNNLTCSMTFVDPGDVVFLTTDGISDNFDPVVTKIAQAAISPTVASPSEKNDSNIAETGNKEICNSKPAVDPTKPEMYPHERHHYSVKEMERTIHEYELLTEAPCSAQELCGAIVQHVCVLTDPKRKVLEDPTLFIKRKMKAKDKKKRDAEIVAKMARAPGKLDHASIVAYEVGVYRGEDEENTDYGGVATSQGSNRGDTLEEPPPSPRLYESTV
ncbi:PP2C-like domain-containing protein CG9801 [Lingula anatina]|nr:PP2C-like domain-containing protein CG9801 [Lingula anatina]|eukprot:XP_013395378.1 PP2C-like domain-containing protein CG9801 [Lingula anatina]